jgi:hypothetical protein
MSTGTGTAPAREPQMDAKTVSAEEGKTHPATMQPATLKQRVLHLLHHIFQGREEHLGWRQ